MRSGEEVSCRLLTSFIRDLQVRGRSLRELAEGCGQPPEVLARASHRISWACLHRVLSNAGQIWSDAEIEELGALSVLDRRAPVVRIASALFVTPLAVYRFMSSDATDRFVRSIDLHLEELRFNEIAIDLHMREGYEPSREFAIWTKGVLRRMPTIVGSDESQVKLSFSEDGARYRILLPRRRGPVRWMRDVLSFPRRAFALAQDLRRAATGLEARSRELWEREEALAHATANLEESEERFHTLFNAAPVSMLITSVETGEILHANRSFTSVTGYPAELVVGRSTGEFDFWPSLEEVYDEQAPEGEARSMEVSLRTFSGDTAVGLLSVQPVSLGGQACVIWQSVDITARKAAEEELRRSRAKLEETMDVRARLLTRSAGEGRAADSRVVNAVAAGVAQQINGPLSAILSSAEFALVCKSDANAQRIWEQALRENAVEAQRCLRIVRSLLQFARGEVTERWPEDLNELVTRCTKLADGYAAERETRLHTTLWDEPLYVNISPIEVEQALNSVLRNAVESRRGAGLVQISTRLEGQGDWARIEVHDDGRGIPAANLERVFEPFFTTRGEEGAPGLGLSAARTIVEEQGGRIELTSEPGAGTTVVIELPLIRPAEG